MTWITSVSPARSTWTLVLCLTVSCGDKSGPAVKETTGTRDSAAPAIVGSIESAAKPTANTTKDPTTAHVIALSKRYTFSNAQHASNAKTGVTIKKNKNQGVKKGQEPDMTLATATLTGMPTINESIVGVIASPGQYAGLGIQQGNNYIYRRVAVGGGPWEVWIVPEDGTPPTMLQRDAMEYSDHPPGRPRLVKEDFKKLRPLMDMVAFGVCIDDPNVCPTNHCGYSQ